MRNERGGILSKILTVPVGVAILVAFFFLGYYLGKQQGSNDPNAQRLESLPDLANQYLPKKEDITFYKTLTEKPQATTGVPVPVPPKPETVHPQPTHADKTSSKKIEEKKTEITITRMPSEPASTPKPKETKKSQEPPASSSNKGRYTVQIASYPDRELAEEEVRRMKKIGYAAFVVSSDVADRGTWYRVRLGSFQNKTSADKLARDVQAKAGLVPLVTAE